MPQQMTAANHAAMEFQQPANPAASSLVPANMNEAIRLADMMSSSKLVPQHLQNQPADCFMVIEQASRWRMSPFAVAQSTSCIQGKLMFEGKLVVAAVHNSGILSRRLDFDFEGEGERLAVIVSGTIRGEDKPRTVRVTLHEAKTNNRMWQQQPQQQLCYSGARVWARRHAPEVMLGVYTPEEFPEGEPPQPAAERNVSPRRAEPAALPQYPEESFAKNFDSWASAIESGKKSAEQIIQIVSSKGVLSEDQKNHIRACATAPEETE